LPLIGRHNVSNALAAIAVGIELGISFEQLARDCEQFEGVTRRFELLGERRGVKVVDDYAHHPTELRAVLEATREAMPGRRLVVVFQPHLYSRTQQFASDFGAVLTIADVAVVLPVYAAREAPVSGVSSQLVVDEAVRHGHENVMLGPPITQVPMLLDELLEEGDLLLTMGAGDVHRVAERWLEAGS
jgi:UDP-N-acetylmuramate--alanine ligase